MNEPDLTLHSEFEETFGSRGGLLVVPADSELHLNVGRCCTKSGDEFLMDNELLTVIAVQQLYDGTLGYRLSRGTDDFGRVGRADEVRWVCPDEPVFAIRYLSEYDTELQTIKVPESRRLAAIKCLKLLSWRIIDINKS